MLGLLLACPLRMRNLQMIEIGRHLNRKGNTFHINFDPDETKTRQALSYEVPQALTNHLNCYLDAARPRS